MIMDTLQNTTVVGNDNVEERRDPLVDKLREAIGKDVLSISDIMKRLGLSHPNFQTELPKSCTESRYRGNDNSGQA